VRSSLGTVVAALAVALLVGCSGPASDTGGADSGTVSAPERAVPGGAEEAPADADRQVVTTATASLSVDDPSEGAQ
jgi:uncharacterized lipoprotein